MIPHDMQLFMESCQIRKRVQGSLLVIFSLEAESPFNIVQMF